MAISNLHEYIESAKELHTIDAFWVWLDELGETINEPYIRTQQNYVNGCQSQVWIVGNVRNGVWNFVADSDSRMVRGICRIVLDVFNGCSSEQIAAIKFHDFKPLAQMLTGLRQRGLQAVINRFHTISGVVPK